MLCPKCSKEMLDVRAEKTNPKAPDFQCPDANCLNDKGYRTGAWLPKGRPTASRAPEPNVFGNTPPSVPRAAQPQGNGSRDAQLVRLYWDCFDEIIAGLKAGNRLMGSGFPAEQIAAMTSTLYIARSKIL